MNIAKQVAINLGKIFPQSVEHKILKELYKPNEVYPPIDPLSYFIVSSDKIKLQTGREQPWKDRRNSFGVIQPGSWDLDCVNYAPSPIANKLYSAKSFVETVHFQSLSNRFIHDYEWEDTELINIVRKAVESGQPAWHGCETFEDIKKQCQHVDDLYTSIKRNGILTMNELNRKKKSFLSSIGDEIMVDVGRTGELLFAHGRHRLSIAKILDLESVPIVISFRHAEWIEQRKELYKKSDYSHPDVPHSTSNNTYPSSI